MTTAGQRDLVYFPGLNSLRAIAALTIIIAHIEIYKRISGLPTLLNPMVAASLSSMAVTLFFTLSGFLITYLLLAERERNTKIDVKAFYIKRALRILPVYFLVVLLGFFVFPKFFIFEPWHDSFINNFYLILPFYLFMLPNFTALFFGHIPYVGIFWSIGVEEQFYLAWPWAMKAKKYLLPILIFLLIAIIALKVLYSYSIMYIPNYYFAKYIKFRAVPEGIFTFIKHLQFECMIIGAICAYLFFKRSKALRFLYRRDFQAVNLMALLTCIFFSISFHLLENLFHSILFSILILNVGTNPKALFTLEYQPMKYLGKISYGLYAFHFTVIIAIMNLLDYEALGELKYNLVLYACSIGITILICTLSYEYFEKPFLKLKGSLRAAPRLTRAPIS